MKKLLSPLIILSCLASASAIAANNIVDQRNLQFVQESITIQAGETVIFKNSDRTAHHIQSKDNGINLNSPLTPPGHEFSYTFDKAGLYTIGCFIHPKMKMTLTVQ
ncbi:MAG: plastocyanin/azurin family copper-binding protein [Pseudomonadota bacterium]